MPGGGLTTDRSGRATTVQVGDEVVRLLGEGIK